MSAGRILLGLTLVALGVLFLLDAQSVLDAGETVSTWWPLLVIALGGLQWLSDRRAVVSSLVLIGIGVVLLGIRLDLFGPNAWSVLWPLVLIGFGAWVLVGRRHSSRMSGDQATASAFALLNGRKLEITSSEFARGDVTAILGAVQVDLTSAVPVPGAELSVTVVMGGCDVIVPEGWKTTITGIPVLGAWDNTTRRDTVMPDAPEITIRVLVVLGGVEVRHAERWGS